MEGAEEEKVNIWAEVSKHVHKDGLNVSQDHLLQ